MSPSASSAPWHNCTSTSSGRNGPRWTRTFTGNVPPTRSASPVGASTVSTRTCAQSALTRRRPSGEFLRGREAVGGQLGRPAVARHIALPGVLLDHAVGVEHRHQGHDRPLHAADPLARDAAGVALVERRRDVLLDQVEQRAALDLVLVREVGVLLAGADGPAVVAVVPLAPPAVEDAQVQARRCRKSSSRWCRTLRAGGAGLFSHTSTPCTK